MINPPELDMEAYLSLHCEECAVTYHDLPALMVNRYEGEAECPEGHHIDVDLFEGP